MEDQEPYNATPTDDGELSLTPAEVDSALWKKLEKHFKQTIASEHRLLEKINLTETETTQARSIIMVMRVLLSLNPENEQL